MIKENAQCLHIGHFLVFGIPLITVLCYRLTRVLSRGTRVDILIGDGRQRALLLLWF